MMKNIFQVGPTNFTHTMCVPTCPSAITLSAIMCADSMIVTPAAGSMITSALDQVDWSHYSFVLNKNVHYFDSYSIVLEGSLFTTTLI